MSETKYLTAVEVRDLGVLQEVNRRLLHPRGLALAVTWYDHDKGGEPEAVEAANNSRAELRITDFRDDPEGVYFDDLDDPDTMRKAGAFTQLMAERARARNTLLGYVVQPLPIAGADDVIVVPAPGDPATVYRDATFSRETRDWLSAAAGHLRLNADRDEDPQAVMQAVQAINDVVARWDANDATEQVLTW